MGCLVDRVALCGEQGEFDVLCFWFWCWSSLLQNGMCILVVLGWVVHASLWAVAAFVVARCLVESENIQSHVVATLCAHIYYF